jgi:hypothetical protein
MRQPRRLAADPYHARHPMTCQVCAKGYLGDLRSRYCSWSCFETARNALQRSRNAARAAAR